jgi:tartrate-resistant acid phosphatase type 5
LGLYTELDGDELEGPESEVEANIQLDWIKDTLEASITPYVVVVGHYPMHSICEHGPTTCLIEKLKPLLVYHKVAAYLNGHDHCA